MIKTINTGVAELVLVKVPDDATGFSMCFHSTRMLFKTSDVSYPRTVGGDAFVDFDRYPKRILGIAHELSEEVWVTIVENVGSWMDLYRNYEREEPYYDTATESGLSLLRANEVYAENPINDGKRGKLKEWMKAQETTGKWVVLKKTNV